jgi:hypothetical protein
MKKPVNAGVHTRHQLQLSEKLYRSYSYSQATSLSDVAAECILFTHGLLFTHGNLPRDPVNDYVAEFSPEHLPFVMELPLPLFSGLEFRDQRKVNKDWNYRLLGMKNEGWNDFYAFMCTVGGVDRDTKRFYHLLAQRIRVVDILELSKRILLPKPLPYVDIIVFGLTENRRLVCIEPAKNPPLDKPRVRIHPPEQAAVDLAEGLFAEEEQPYSATDQVTDALLLEYGADGTKKVLGVSDASHNESAT